MRRLSFRLKQNLARMRVEQRIQQRLEEKNDELRGVAQGRSNFCATCKLNYRQDRLRHNESEMHKVISQTTINIRLHILETNHRSNFRAWSGGFTSINVRVRIYHYCIQLFPLDWVSFRTLV